MLTRAKTLARGAIFGCVVALGSGASPGCGDESFVCESDQECMVDVSQGVCQATGYCTFFDPACGSQQRYSDNAGDGLAGQCLDGDPATGTGDNTSDAATSGGSGSADSGSATSGTVTSGALTSGSSGVGETTVGDSTSTSGGSGVDPYDDCNDDDDCPFIGSVCQDSDDFEQACAPPCTASSDCPPGLGGPVPECVEIGGASMCILPCVQAAECPDGTLCVPVEGFGACMWD